MKLTDGEKLIALMLADLLDHVGAKGEVDPEFIKHAIFHSNTWSLEWKYPGLFTDEEEPSADVIRETGDILTMCRVVEASISQLPDDQRAEIPEKERRVFIGFDGNEEMHYSVALALVEQLDRFREFADYDFNSHHPTLRRYRAMLAVYERMNLNMGAGLSLESIQAILAAPRGA